MNLALLGSRGLEITCASGESIRRIRLNSPYKGYKSSTNVGKQCTEEGIDQYAEGKQVVLCSSWWKTLSIELPMESTPNKPSRVLRLLQGLIEQKFQDSRKKLEQKYGSVTHHEQIYITNPLVYAYLAIGISWLKKLLIACWPGNSFGSSGGSLIDVR